MKEYIVQAFDSQNPIKLAPFYAEDVPELVRCKDCYGNRNDGLCHNTGLHYGEPIEDHWYCADGVRKE